MKFWVWEEIPRHDTEEYLTRLIVFRCKLFGILVHWFKGSDDECATHNHPWAFISCILRGGYWEYTPGPDGKEIGRWYHPLSMLYRPANWVHRVEFERHNPALTLVLHGPKTSEWGFFTKRFGFVHHKDYNYHKHCLPD